MGTIAVTNLGKAYKKYPSRRARLADWLLPADQPRYELHWVLREINFVVNAGEAVGIIGMNGAGKSTLLKMITGTTLPTTGSVNIQGSMAALLELGMGFHPDFTGRQNAYMAGQLLGLKTEEITRLMPEIESFAEIGEYIDQPVRVYSSGMQVRLAFAVATARRPDILIVDEALSVGDAYFQHKSFDRIREFQKLGTTLLIVSHDKSAIQSICDRAILLKEGQVIKEGKPDTVFDFYNALLADHENQSIREKESFFEGKVQTLSGNGEATIIEAWMADETGNRIELAKVGQRVLFGMTIQAQSDLPELVIGFIIKDRLGQEVFGTNTHHLDHTIHHVAAGTKLRFAFELDVNLGPGTYSLTYALHTQDTHLLKNYEWRDVALVFNVINTTKPPFVGLTWIQPQARILE
jgi:lipopolysaccharide transport system ATP-binding protein